MSAKDLYPVPEELAKTAWADKASYQAMYRASIEDPAAFWGEHGKRIDWIKPYTQVKDVSYNQDDLHIRWYYDRNHLGRG